MLVIGNSKNRLATLLAVVCVIAFGCSSAKESRMHLQVVDDGSYLLDGKKVSAEELPQRLSEMKQRTPHAELQVTATEKASYAQLAAALKITQDAGLGSVGFVSDPPPRASDAEKRNP